MSEPAEETSTDVDFAALFTSLPTAYLVMAPDLTILDANRAYLRLLGRTRADLVGRYVFDAFPPTPDALDDAGRNTLQLSFERARDSGRADVLPLYSYGVTDPATGQVAQRYWSLVSAPVLDAGGRTVLVLQRVEDVTDWVAQRGSHPDHPEVEPASAAGSWQDRALAVEADLYIRVQELRAAQAAREAAVERLAALSTTALALAEVGDVADLLTTIAERGLGAVGADGGAVAVPDPEDPDVLLSYVTNSYGSDAQADYARLPLQTALPVCLAAATDQRVLIADRAAAAAFSPEMEAVVTATGSQAFASLPLRAGGTVIGVLTAGWRAPQSFETEQLDLLETLAAQCAQALQRVQALQAERESAEQARTAAAQQAGLVAIAHALGEASSENAVLEVVAAQGVQLLGSNGAGLCLLERDGAHVRSLVTSGYGLEVASIVHFLPADFPLPAIHAAATGATHFLPDRASTEALFPGSEVYYADVGVQASAAAPMRAHGRLLGCLSVGFEAARTWSLVDRELVEALAALTAQALDRLAARDDERSATAQQAGLVAVAQALEAAGTETDVLEVVVTRGVPLLGAQGAVLCVVDPPTQAAPSSSTASGPVAAVRSMTTAFFDDRVRAEVTELPADSPLPMVHAAVTGAAHFLPDRAAAVALFPGAAELYAAAGTEASAAVPLRDGTQVKGSLSIAFDAAHVWEPAERDLVEAFAALTGQALNRIHAHQAEQAASAAVARFSETLQRSLLTAPPQPDHLQIAVRYVPASADAHVGGDWYDAFLTSGGSTSLVIGDVTGHDQGAAAAMGQLRNVLRGIGYAVGEPPARVLSVLDQAAHDLAIGALATVVVAQVEQDEEHRATGTRVLRWSNAGHPPPLLVTPDGTTRFLDTAPDLLLGIDPDTVRIDHEVVLAPGSTVLLFTDGLVERRGAHLQDGLDWLATAAAGLADLDLEGFCDGLLALVGDRVEDDVALLALRAHPEDGPRPAEAGESTDPRSGPTLESASTSDDHDDGEGDPSVSGTGDAGVMGTEAVPQHSLVMEPDPAAVRQARTFVAARCSEAGVQQEVCDSVVLLTSELVTNAFLHGRSRTLLAVTATSCLVRVEVSDDNSRHPVLPGTDDDALDGRGMTMVAMLATDWGVHDRPIGKAIWFELGTT